MVAMETLEGFLGNCLIFGSVTVVFIILTLLLIHLHQSSS